MQTPMKDKNDALVPPDVISLASRPDDELSPRPQSERFMKPDSNGRRTQEDDTDERLKDTAGLLALEMVVRQNTEKEYNEVLNSANNSRHQEQVQLLTELTERRRDENRALTDENRQLKEQLQHMRIAEPITGPFTNIRETMIPTATAPRYRPSLSYTNPRNPIAPMAHTFGVVQDTKIFGELGQLESTLIQTNFRAEGRIGVTDVDNHETMFTTVQKLRFFSE